MNKRTLELRRLMDDRGLNCVEVAHLVSRSHGTVRQWRIGYRVIPVKVLRGLRAVRIGAIIEPLPARRRAAMRKGKGGGKKRC